MKNKDQKSLESIYESIKLVREENEEESQDDFVGDPTNIRDTRKMGSIGDETAEIPEDESLSDLDREGDEDDEGSLGISREELDEILASIDERHPEEADSSDNVPQDVASDMEEEGLR